MRDENRTIVLGSNDIYQINSQMTWTETFEWDVKGNNLFDEKLSFVLKEMKGSNVKTVQLTQIYDLNIGFSNGYQLEVFIDSTSGEEQWRFFKTHVKPHYVVTARGIK